MFLARSWACVSQNLMVVIQVMLHLPIVSSLQAIFDSKHLLGSRPPGEAAATQSLPLETSRLARAVAQSC